MNATPREVVDCPTCLSPHSTPWAEENGFTAVKCQSCGTVYVRERPAANAIDEATKTGVHSTTAGDLDVRMGFREWKIKHYTKIVRAFFADDPPRRWLDVGAGYGEVVSAVTRAFPNVLARGIEPMRDKAEAAARRGVCVSAEPLSAVTEPADVVSLINVFSHIPDFPAFAADVRRVLATGGSLFLETGNGGDLRSRSQYPDQLYLPDHLVFVGIEQMQRILRRCGFTRIEYEARRLDTLGWSIRQTGKAILRGRPRVVLPYMSAFRTVFYRAWLA